MKSAVAIVFVFSAVALASALPSLRQTELEPLTDEGRGWQTWTALRNWMRPATNYITDSLPDKTPTEFATDVRDAAVDMRDRAQDHPAVQGVARVVRPVHQWVREKATDLSSTSFRDMFDSAKGFVQSTDERVANWMNNRATNGQLQQYPHQSLAENIEILH